MKVRQYVYLSIHSDDVMPDGISRAIGLAGDEGRERGSRRAGASPLPRDHTWKLYSGLPDVSTLDDQLSALAVRISSASEAIKAFAARAGQRVWVQVVRNFEYGREDDEILAQRDRGLPPGIEVLRGQHPLLGFSLRAELIADLAGLGVDINFDEYGDEYE